MQLIIHFDIFEKKNIYVYKTESKKILEFAKIQMI